MKQGVTSDGNFFRVTFKSNDAYDKTGFEAFYQFRKQEGLDVDIVLLIYNMYLADVYGRHTALVGQLASTMACT